MKSTTLNRLLLILTLFAFVALEIVCARMAFYTIGEIVSGLYYLFIAINLIPLYLIIFKAKDRAAFITAWIFVLGIAALVIPYQLYLGNKWLLLKGEAANITTYVYQGKLESGQYPQDLSGYTFTKAELEQHFRYETSHSAKDPFSLSYYVGTPDTTHYYSFYTQKWEYYPD